MQHHTLKTHTKHFSKLWSGMKTAEVRKEDRGFEIGDFIHLYEWEPEKQDYTGRAYDSVITDITPLDFMGAPDYVLLSFPQGARRFNGNDDKF